MTPPDPRVARLAEALWRLVVDAPLTYRRDRNEELAEWLLHEYPDLFAPAPEPKLEVYAEAVDAKTVRRIKKHQRTDVREAQGRDALREQRRITVEPPNNLGRPTAPQRCSVCGQPLNEFHRACGGSPTYD